MRRDWRLASWFSLAGLLWCVVVGLLLWFLPLGETASSSSAGGTTARRLRSNHKLVIIAPGRSEHARLAQTIRPEDQAFKGREPKAFR